MIEIAAKRFHLGDENSAIAHGVTFHIVVVTITMGVVVIVQTVCAHYLDEGLVFYRRLGNIGKVYARGITLQLDVQAEAFFLYGRT